MSFTKSQLAEIKATVDTYCTAYESRDLQTLMSLFAPEISGFGGGADEIIPARHEYKQLIRRDLTQASSMRIEFLVRGGSHG